MFLEEYGNNEILWNYPLSDFKKNRKKDIFKTAKNVKLTLLI